MFVKNLCISFGCHDDISKCVVWSKQQAKSLANITIRKLVEQNKAEPGKINWDTQEKEANTGNDNRGKLKYVSVKVKLRLLFVMRENHLRCGSAYDDYNTVKIH